MILAPYDRIISQLLAEVRHAIGHDCHEARRRQQYAMKVLDAFGAEFKKAYKHADFRPAEFRSKVLTPILQRQLAAIPDAYTPTVRAAIPSSPRESITTSSRDRLTIRDVTEFYLGLDPTDPKHIRSYRRNLLLIPEARWHLGLMKLETPGSPEAIARYLKVRVNHDLISDGLMEEGHTGLDKYKVPLLTHAEIRCIIDEGLEGLFAQELTSVVSNTPPSPTPSL
jgi:hypothetical protein